MVFLIISLMYGLDLYVGDLKNAFCQSDKLRRPRGRVFVEPCDGLRLPPGSLIELIAPVYGLDDAPLALHKTTHEFMTQEGYQKASMEPCWFYERHGGRLRSQVLVEVDDWLIAVAPEIADDRLARFTGRFKFGKLKQVSQQGTDFIGRRLRRMHDRVLVDQEKYILENLRKIELPRERRSNHSRTLLPHEFEEFRSLIYRLNWVGRESRAEAAGAASMLASRLNKACIGDVLEANRMVEHLRNTAQVPLIVWPFRPGRMVFATASDCGGVGGLDNDKVQQAWQVYAADASISEGNLARVTPTAWRSSRIRRAVPSTLGGEVLALSGAVAEAEWLQMLFMDVTKGGLLTEHWRDSVGPFTAVLRQDCKLNTDPLDNVNI